MKDGKGKGILLALGAPSEEEETEEADDYSEEKLSLSEEMLDAFENKDAEALSEAMSAFVAVCSKG